MSAPLSFPPQENPYTSIRNILQQTCQKELKNLDNLPKKTSSEFQNTLLEKIKSEISARIAENPQIQLKLKELPVPPGNPANLYTAEILEEIEKYFSKRK